MEKASLWLVDTMDTKNFDPIENMNDLYIALRDLKRMCLYKHKIEHNTDTNTYDFKKVKSDRQASKVIQEMFRNLKVYDFIINFINANIQLFYEVAEDDVEEEDFIDQAEQYKMARKVFKSCFRLLTAFVTHNPINQRLMWKYKEFFVFPQLGNAEQLGELEFVKAILEKSDLPKAS